MENKTNNERFQIYSVNLKQMFDKVKKLMTKKHIHYNDLTNQLKDINEKISKDMEINVDKYFNLIKMSLETDNIKLIEAVLDHMHKLIKEDLFTGQTEEASVDRKTLKKFNYFYLKKRYIDSFIESLVKLYNISDDNILLQVVMILYTICKNSNTNIHNESLITIFRFYIRVYLASRTTINVDTTKSTLNSIVSLFFSRMEQFNAVIYARESAVKVSTLCDLPSNYECEKSELALNIAANNYLTSINNTNNILHNQEFQRRNTSNSINANLPLVANGSLKTSNLSNINLNYANNNAQGGNTNNINSNSTNNNNNIFNPRASANFGFNTEAFGASAYSNSTTSMASNVTNFNTIHNLNTMNNNNLLLNNLINNNNQGLVNYLNNNNSHHKQNHFLLYKNPVDTMLQKQLTSLIDDVCLIDSREALLSSLKQDIYTYGSEELKTEHFAFFKKFSTSISANYSKTLLLKSTPDNALALTTNFEYYEKISLANPQIKNEKGAESGLFGWCYSCRAKADFYCKATRLPVCSLRCKLKISEEDEEIAKYISGELLGEDDIALLYLSDSQNIFAFLCKLVNSSVDSNEANNTKAKLIALELILSILEKPGNIFTSNREFVNIIKSNLIEGLLRACMSDDLQIYSFSIKIFFKVWNFFREHLKHQISVFIETVFLKILDSGNSTYNHKWLLLENFYKLAGTAKFFVELYVNYDCDIEEKDLLNRIVTSLSKISQGKYAKLEHQLSPQQEYQLRSRSLEVIWMMIHSVLKFAEEQIGSNTHKNGVFEPNLENEMQNNLNDDNLDDNASFMFDANITTNNNANLGNASMMTNSNNINNNNNFDTLAINAAQAANANIIREKLDFNRKIKSDISTAVEKFNIKVKNGILYLKKTGMVNRENKDLEAFDIANFLKNTHGLKKEHIGEFLGDNNEVALKALDYYTQTFDFRGLHIIEAIRVYLSGFQLPGEGQKIDRIMEKFAAKYYKDNTGKFETADCAYYLAFSIIMLQTDTHNPQVKKKMGVEGFKKMIKGINGGKDLDDEFINDVYLQILQKPISLVEYEEAKDKMDANRKKTDLFKRETERMYQEGTERLKKNQEKVYLKICEIDHISLMLESIWTCLLAMFSLIIEDSEDPSMTKKSVEGISFCIKLCGMLNLDLQKEALTRAFCKLTNIVQGKEIKEKHINCIQAILDLATHDGNHLKGSWKMVLELISKIDYYHMTVCGSKSELEAFFTEVRNKKRLQQANNPNIDKEILTEKNNMEKIGREINQDDYELIFSKTVYLDDDTLIDFVTSLCEISKEELANKDAPRIFSLQKLVEVAELNIRRVRMTWSQIWGIISEHLTQVGSNPSPNIAEKAIDSLRQLAKKLLLKDEISVYKFQMDFLKPFENILVNNINSYRTKEYVLTCITNLVLAEAASIKSGWRIIFNIFSLASDDDTEQGLNRKTFDTIVKVFNNHFSQIKDNYTEFAHCLKKYSLNYPEECINIYKNSYDLLDEIPQINSLLLCLGSLVRDERENIRNISCSAFFHIIKKIAEATINDSESNETNDSFNTGKNFEFSVAAKSLKENTASSISFNPSSTMKQQSRPRNIEQGDFLAQSEENAEEGMGRRFNPSLSHGENTNELGLRTTIKIDYSDYSNANNNNNFIKVNNTNQFMFAPSASTNGFGNNCFISNNSSNGNFFNNTHNNSDASHHNNFNNFINPFAIPKITFDSEYWKNLFKNIFKPIIDDLIGVKLSTTLEIFLVDLDDIFMGAYDKIDYLLENYLEIFTDIISCDNESTAVAGFDAFKILIEKLSQNSSKRINEKFWEKIIKTISLIFSKTLQEDFLKLDINNFDDPSFQKKYKDIVFQNIIFCIIQDNLIKLSDEIIEYHYDKLNYEQLNILIECLRESWEIAYTFNIEFNLRQLIHYHFITELEKVVALFKQHQDGTFIFFKALNKIIDTPNNKLANDEIRANARAKILENSKKLLQRLIDRINYNEDQIYLYEENERVLSNLVPVIMECVFTSLEKVDFLKDENDRSEFTQLLIELITCNNLGIRMKVKELLSEIFRNFSGNSNTSKMNKSGNTTN